MSMAYPGLKFVYNWADSEWIYVEIDDTERGYFWPDYVEFDDSFEWHDWYKVVPDNEGGDTRDASYTYNQYFNNEERYWYITPKTLKEDFLECFENHLYDSLFNASTSYHSYSNIGSDYKEIYWYKNCIDSAREDIYMDSLIEKWNEITLDCLKSDLERYLSFEEHDKDLHKEEADHELNRVIEGIQDYWTFNGIKAENFNIKAYIENKKVENLDEIIEFVKNWNKYFN